MASIRELRGIIATAKDLGINTLGELDAFLRQNKSPDEEVRDTLLRKSIEATRKKYGIDEAYFPNEDLRKKYQELCYEIEAIETELDDRIDNSYHRDYVKEDQLISERDELQAKARELKKLIFPENK